MSSRLDFETARKRQLVWERGALPAFQDGWAPAKHDETRDLKGERNIYIPWRLKEPVWEFAYAVSLPCERSAWFLYRFHALLPGHRDAFERVAKGLVGDPKFLAKFRRFLDYEYFREEDPPILSDDKMSEIYVIRVMLRGAKKPRKRPKEYSLEQTVPDHRLM